MHILGRGKRQTWIDPAIFGLVALAIWLPTRTVDAQPGLEPSVQIELITEKGFPIGGEHKWIQMLRDLRLTNTRIRRAREGEEPAVENRGSETNPRYFVRGVLTGRNRLVLPGKTFSASDRGGIAGWFRELKDRGIRAVGEPKVKYGLTSKEMVSLLEALAKPVPIDPYDRPVRDVVKQVSTVTGLEVKANPKARAALATRQNCLDHMQGVSAGTVLTASVRLLGLVAVPRPGPQGKTSLELVPADEAKEFLPVGWPAARSPGKHAPKLFKYAPVAIDDTPLNEVLDAIHGRVEIPFLYDHNNMLRQRIDPTQVRINLPRQDIYYKKLLDKVLREALLKSDLRMDEAGEPILWITPLKTK